MKQTAFKPIFISLLFILLPLCVSAQSLKYKVSLDVQITDQSSKDTIESYLARELRSLGDVEVVSDGTFTISVLAIKTFSQTGAFIGYALSTVITRKEFCGHPSLNYKCDAVLTHSINLVNPDGLRSVCEQIIVKFDTKVLKTERQLDELIKKIEKLQ